MSDAHLRRDEQRIVRSLFEYTGKFPSEVGVADAQRWLRGLEEKGIGAGTAYQHACLLFSCYSWAMCDPEVGRHHRRRRPHHQVRT